MSKKWIIAIAAGLAVVAGVAYWTLFGGTVPVEAYEVRRASVREFIAEEAKTRLSEEYVIDMPLSGVVNRIGLEEGDAVETGQALARVDAYALEQQIEQVDALIVQTRSNITGVDVAKPKPAELEAAGLRVQSRKDSLAVTRQQQRIAKNNLAEAERTYERTKALLDSGAVSRQRFDEAERNFLNAKEAVDEAAYQVEAARKALEIAEANQEALVSSIDDNEYRRDALKAEIARLEAEKAALQDDLNKATLESPIDGVVLARHTEGGVFMTAGRPLLTLGDPGDTEIESDILSEEVVRVEEGDPVEIHGKAVGDGMVMGHVKRIYPRGFEKISSLGVEQQRVKTLISFDNSALGLRPGTRVDVRIVTERHEGVLVIPERSMFRHEDGWAVFRIGGGLARPKLELTPIEVGLSNTERTEVLEGLEAGARIVAEPANELSDGAKVEVTGTQALPEAPGE